jgi:hypothetical protein
MDRSQDRMEDDPEPPNDDPRNLVAALTHLLLEDSSSTQEQAETDLRSTNHATSPADAILREVTSTRSISVLPDNERETSPLLPAFLSDSQVRAALQRANSLKPQGHLSDEPQFPSSLANAQSQIQAERDWREAPARPSYPIIGYPDISCPPNTPANSSPITHLTIEPTQAYNSSIWLHMPTLTTPPNSPHHQPPSTPGPYTTPSPPALG